MFSTYATIIYKYRTNLEHEVVERGTLAYLL